MVEITLRKGEEILLQLNSLTEEEKHYILLLEDRMQALGDYIARANRLNFLVKKLVSRLSTLNTAHSGEGLKNISACKATLSELKKKAEEAMRKHRDAYQKIMGTPEFIMHAKQSLEKEQHLLPEDLHLKFYQTKEISDALQSPNIIHKKKAENKLGEIIKSLKESIRVEMVAEHINDELTRILESLRRIPQEITKLLEEQQILIKQCLGLDEKDLIPASTQKLEVLENNLEISLLKLEEMGAEEKNHITDPLNKYLEQKRDVYKRIKILATKKGLEDGILGRLRVFSRSSTKITKKDVADDIRLFSQPYEVQRYVNELRSLLSKHPFWFESGMDRYLYHLAGASARASEKQAYIINLLNRYSMFDELTQIPNLRYFRQEIYKHVERCLTGLVKNNQNSFAIMMFDIDNFKKFNSVYGHTIADGVLKAVATFAQKSIEGMVFRTGGEEFHVLVEVNSKEDALKIAQRIRQNVEKKSEEVMQKLNELEDKGIRHITISIGLLFCPDDIEKNILDETEKLKVAQKQVPLGLVDNAINSLRKVVTDGMNLSKEKGRNVVCYIHGKDWKCER